MITEPSFWEIIAIKEHNGHDKDDPDKRLGRIMQIADYDIVVGKSMLMRCVGPGYHKSMITSPVVEWWLEDEDNKLFIKTEHTIYELRRTDL